MNKYLSLFLIIIIISSCNLFGPGEPPEPECRIGIGDSDIIVTANRSGEKGTQISPDEIVLSSITTNTAEAIFRVHGVGSCHEVTNYGHVWSSTIGTPTIDNSSHSDFGSNVNFGDLVNSFMSGLTPNTKYFLRGYIAIRSLENGNEKVLYNDEISSFITLRQCNEGEQNVLNDSDRQTIVESYSGNAILSFEIIRKEVANCENGLWIEADKTDKWVEITNEFSNSISCDYLIDYKQFDDYGNVAVEWIYQNQISRLEPNQTFEQLMHDKFGNIQHGQIDVVLSNVIFH